MSDHVRPISELVLRERPINGVLLLRLNRPEKLNALSLALRRALADALLQAEADDTVRSVVITGSARAFAAGADLAELIDLEPGDARFEELRVAWNAMASSTKPIVAAIRGLALGGGFELALQCDLIIASDKARFGLPESQVGIVPGAGGMQRLARLIGRQQTLFWLVTGGMIDAESARSRGIVAEVVDDEAVVDRGIALAARIAELPREVTATLKRAMELSENAFVRAAVETERPWFERLFGTSDQREGMGRMLERMGQSRKN